jgi:hypothetical protein
MDWRKGNAPDVSTASLAITLATPKGAVKLAKYNLIPVTKLYLSGG